jgi:Leucine-rich repeat (LRR) protein
MNVDHFVTAATILSLCVMTSSCPIKCTCFLQETKCLNASLSAIPQTINNNTVTLTISYNNIQRLMQDSVTYLAQLRFVFLNMNGVESLGPRIPCASRELIILNLSKNEIISINSESFSCLQKLSYLYLNENKISYIDSSPFKKTARFFFWI